MFDIKPQSNFLNGKETKWILVRLEHVLGTTGGKSQINIQVENIWDNIGQTSPIVFSFKWFLEWDLGYIIQVYFSWCFMDNSRAILIAFIIHAIKNTWNFSKQRITSCLSLYFFCANSNFDNDRSILWPIFPQLSRLIMIF